MRKHIYYPALALVLGGLGAVLRMWQRAAAYDESGLPVSMAAPSVVLALFLAACAGLFLFLSFQTPKTTENQSAAVQGSLYSTLLTVSGVLVLLCGAFCLVTFAGSYLEVSGSLYGTAQEQSQALRGFLFSHLLILALALASVPAAVALVYCSKLARTGGELNAFAALMPPFFCWIWLIEVYRQHTANPILWDYILLLLAVIALLVSGYYRAGFAFGAGKPRRAVFSSLLALSLTAAGLPDCGGLASAAALVGMELYTFAGLLGLTDRLAPAYHPRRLAGESGAPLSPPDSQIQEETSHE